eukprot:SAG11_NODE_32877_length_280_cov_0.845304_1_plen_49_part_10
MLAFTLTLEQGTVASRAEKPRQKKAQRQKKAPHVGIGNDFTTRRLKSIS